ncbi:hypothetical protein R3F64_09460 [Halomonas sp. 5021]|uniref:hypothetical protein n=1 Tax=Halomonas sp. 5021 TaxID=3082156 RepID=UPI002FCA3E2C
MTNFQLMHGLAALLGQMVGTMLSIEFLVPAIVGFYRSRRPSHILIFSVYCALLGTAVFIALNGTKYAIFDFCIRYLASVLFIGFLYGLRALFRTFRRSGAAAER